MGEAEAGIGAALPDVEKNTCDWMDLKPMTAREKNQAEKQKRSSDLDNMVEAKQAEVEYEKAREIIRKKATEILTTGRPFDFFTDTFKMDHEGDLTAARVIALAFASSSVANGNGLHVFLAGNSGKGKTHTTETMFRQLPDKYRYDRSFSDKYLFYAGSDPKNGLFPGVVIAIDDQTMTPSVQEIFKVSVSHFQNGTFYGTVQNQKPVTLHMPARVSWVLLKVDDPGDDQAMNRLIQARIAEDDEKIRSTAKFIQQKYKGLAKKQIRRERQEIEICKAIWSILKDQFVAVEVPCAGHVIFSDYENLRNHELFFNIMMAHAVIHRWQRPEIGKTEDGIPIIEATEADFKEALLIFEALHKFGGQKHNTLKNEDTILEALIRMKPEHGLFTVQDVAAKTGLSYQVCYRGLHGRKDKGNDSIGGLLQKCPFIQDVGSRGRHEKDVTTDQNRSGAYTHIETTRRESFNERIYSVNVEALNSWMSGGIPIALDRAFQWEVPK